MQGRYNYYEGYKMKEITCPVFVMSELTINKLIIINSCGGIAKISLNRKGNKYIISVSDNVVIIDQKNIAKVQAF